MFGLAYLAHVLLILSSMARELPVEPDAESGHPHPGINSDAKAALVPRCVTLSGFGLEACGHEGIAIRSLEPGTTLSVQTRNSQYRLIVLDGGDDHVLVQGGALFPEATTAYLQGASAGGSLVRTGWIEVGLRLELLVDSHRIVTSPVRSVTIETLPPRYSSFRPWA